MTREQIVAVMQTMQRGWNAKDPVALAAIHADDSVVHSPMFGEVRGRSQIERTYREMFRTFEDWTWESGDLIIDGDRCAQLFEATAIHSQEMFGVPATHRRFRVQGVLVFELRDGKISSERRLYDFTSLLVQVGVLKAKPGK